MPRNRQCWNVPSSAKSRPSSRCRRSWLTVGSDVWPSGNARLFQIPDCRFRGTLAVKYRDYVFSHDWFSL